CKGTGYRIIKKEAREKTIPGFDFKQSITQHSKLNTQNLFFDVSPPPHCDGDHYIPSGNDRHLLMEPSGRAISGYES
ncbi:MAG: hypothetical protein WBI10_12040, partial [Syntrophales bacterium]